MKFTLVASLLAATATAINVPRELLGRTGPCGDNCGRAIKAGSQGEVVMAAHANECSTYLQVTTTPEPTTVYITKTIPTYASACSGRVRYLTACSCVASAVTVEAPRATVTSVVYA